MTEYEKVEREHDIHLDTIEHDFDSNCIECFNYIKRLEQLDPSTMKFEAYMTRFKGSIVLKPDPNDIFNMIVGRVIDKKTIWSKYRISTMGIDMLKYSEYYYVNKS